MKVYLLVLATILTACASRPQLYPNEKFKSTGRDAADRDIATCEKLADEYMTSGKGAEIARGAASGAAVGGVAGAVAGAFSRSVFGGALVGAAVGGAAAGTAAAVSPDQLKRSYVDQCLKDKGYQVVGWR